MKIHHYLKLTSWLFLLAVPGVAHAWSSGMISETASLHQFSTHDKVIASAYSRLVMARPDLAAKLPPLKTILQFEGVGGPDGRWAKGLDDDSHHYCNPDIQNSDDAAYIVGELAQEIHSNVSVKGDQRELAKNLASVAHYIADSLSPPHEFGQQRNGATGSKDNWDDPNWDGHGYFDSPHFMFELHEVLYPIRGHLTVTFFGVLAGFIFALRRTSPNRKVARRWIVAGTIILPFLAVFFVALMLCNGRAINRYSDPLMPITPQDAPQSIRDAAHEVKRSGTWELFTKFGWNDEVERSVRLKILPDAAEMVARIWEGAIN